MDVYEKFAAGQVIEDSQPPAGALRFYKKTEHGRACMTIYLSEVIRMLADRASRNGSRRTTLQGGKIRVNLEPCALHLPSKPVGYDWWMTGPASTDEG